MAAFVSEISTARRSAWTLPVLAYAAFVVACAALLHPTLAQMAGVWLKSSSYHHGVAVAPLALWMILTRPRLTPSTHAASLIGVLLSCMLWLAGNAAGAAIIEQIAFVSLLISGAGVIFGATALRQWAAALLFLYFMVPFGAVLVPPLQYATANAVASLFSLAGMPVSLDGIFMRTSAGVFEIAEACAGLNFLLAALMIAAFYACQFLRANRTRIAFVAIAAIAALFANFLRVFILILIATVTDMRIAIGPDHLVIGLVFYAIVLGVLIAIGENMRRREKKSDERPPSMMFNPWRPLVALSAFAPIVAASFYAGAVIHAPVNRTAPAVLSPLSAQGWRILPGPENWRPPTTADRSLTATYDNRESRVYAAMSYFTHDRTGAEIVNYHNRAWDGEEWRRIGGREDMVYLFGAAQMTPIDLIAGAEGRRLAAITVYWRDHETFTDARRFKLAQMKEKLQGRNPAGGMIILAATYRDDPTEALNTLRPFTHTLEDFASWRERNVGSSNTATSESTR